MKIALRLLRDTIEIYVPVLSFVVMFLAFVLQIFYRYVMNAPSTWAFELTRIAFVWSVLFGAIYTMRKREHLTFTLVYDLFPTRVQAYIRILSNSIVCLGFCIVFQPSLHYIQFMSMMSTTTLDIPMSLVYGPFLIFLAMVIVYSAIDVIQDIRVLLGRPGPGAGTQGDQEHSV